MPDPLSPGRTSPSVSPPISPAGQRTDAAAAATAAPTSPQAARVGQGQRPAALEARPERPQTPDLQLAGYLLARELVGQPVAASTQALLQRANESKKEVLRLMTHGRANVSTDLQTTGQAGFHRLLAQRHVVGSTSSLGEPPLHSHARDAALAAHVGAGNCGEFASVAAHLHAARLQAGERMVIQKADPFDHSWVLIEGPPSPGGTTARAVLDVWSEGPVIEAGDGAFTANPRNAPLTQHTIEHADAAQAHQHFEALRTEPGERIARRLDALIAANQRNEREPTGTVYEPMTSVSAVLCADAAQAVQARADDPALKRSAAAIGQQLAAIAPEEEDRAAERIVAFAGALDATQPRHLTQPSVKRQRTEPAD